MMHIAFLTSEYPHEKVQHAAGIGTSIKNLVVALRAAGITVSVFVYGQALDEVIVENGVKIHLLANKSYRFFGWYKHRKHIARYLNRHIISDKIDLVEAPDWTGITAFMNLKAPLVIRFHGSDAYFCHLEKRKQKFKNFLFEKLGILKASAFIAPTDFAAETTKYIFRIEGKPIQTINYGLSLSQFNNPEPTQFTKRMILYIGTLIRKKGVFELIRIFEKVLEKFPDAQLMLIGGDSFDIKTQSASTWQLLQDQMDKSVKGNVKYLGKVPYKEIQQHIKNANVCVFPTFAETLGMVTIESMAMQKAVVNSNIGWSKELIDDGVNGYLVHPENHDLYADRIVSLLNDDSLCVEIGKSAREKVENKFDIEKKAAENIAFYDCIIKDKNRWFYRNI
jgi:glycosyltransferase involved in cell wall biosynthesis